MLRTLLLPLWLIQIFSPAKSFRDNPVLGNRLLNRLGLHVARYVLRHVITRLRWIMLAPLVPAGIRQEFRRRGVVEIADFLPAERFAALKRELESCQGEVRQMRQGDTLTQTILLDAAVLPALPQCRALVEDRGTQRLLMYVGARLKRPLFFIHRVRNGAVDGGADPQKDFYSDTFHSTMKAWLFMGDVDDNIGPFSYIEGSHRLTWARLKWEYRQSVLGRNLGDSYGARGSLRLTQADRIAIGLPEPTRFTVRANTLVIADTHGFHARGAARREADRLAIYASSRSNPFNPLPGLLPDLTGRLEAMALRMMWARGDKRAARQGGLASWHKVPSSAFHDGQLAAHQEQT